MVGSVIAEFGFPGNYGPRDALTPAQREALVLTQLEGIPYETVAAQLGVSEGTVKSRVNRAKAKLKEWLSENGELSPGNNVKQDEKGRGGNRP